MDEEKKNSNNNNKRKKFGFIVLAFVLLVGAVSLFFYLGYKATHITTDDAFIEGRMHTIASKIRGTVSIIHVTDNQLVKKGDLLIEIDPADFAVKVEEAESGTSAEKAKLTEVDAQISVSKTQIAELHAALEAAKANLELQEANFQQAVNDSRRAENLYKSEAISRERYEKTMTSHTIASAQVKAAREQLKQAEKALGTQGAVVRQVEALRGAQMSAIKENEAKLNAAQLNFGYTKIYAPSDGYITRKSVEIGNQVEAGRPLMAVVTLEDIWITANYKETQLEKVRPGQKVAISVDTYPGKEFHGKVESIMSGTGAVFSLFPPENATGNYVKVVQRIPIKIVFDKETDKDHILRVGMSVVPTILIE
ncbi:MAG: HlyD family secretion protein [Thermodesulfovibrionales bacterium]|nr:HlyD family secretion protein [Thermodesulfovibrionales bacterium]